jgi:hypothetical protein
MLMNIKHGFVNLSRSTYTKFFLTHLRKVRKGLHAVQRPVSITRETPHGVELDYLEGEGENT